jgi:hypothetical protein
LVTKSCLLLSRWFIDDKFSTLKMEAICSSETSVDFQRTHGVIYQKMVLFNYSLIYQRMVREIECQRRKLTSEAPALILTVPSPCLGSQSPYFYMGENICTHIHKIPNNFKCRGRNALQLFDYELLLSANRCHSLPHLQYQIL